MSLINQQIISGKLGVVAYSAGMQVAGSGGGSPVVKLIDVDLFGEGYVGVSIGIGVSDLTAWGSGLKFDVLVGGRVVMSIVDEICTLLDKEFIPIDMPRNTRLSVSVTNYSLIDVDVSVFVRAEHG